jgi:hypothetical protein
MLSMAVAAANCGEDKIAIEACEGVLNSYQESRYGPAARTLLARLNGVGRTVSRSRNELPGRLIPYERQLILPGFVDFALDIDRTNMGDILDYEVGYSIRSGCRLKSFWYRVSLLEPQPPPVGKSPLRFFRAPVLALAE